LTARFAKQLLYLAREGSLGGCDGGVASIAKKRRPPHYCSRHSASFQDIGRQITSRLHASEGFPRPQDVPDAWPMREEWTTAPPRAHWLVRRERAGTRPCPACWSGPPTRAALSGTPPPQAKSMRPPPVGW